MSNDQKRLFLAGFVLLSLSIASNTLISKMMLDSHKEKHKAIATHLTRASDSLYTALSYLKDDKGESFVEEILRAEEHLKTPELIKLRREAKKK